MTTEQAVDRATLIWQLTHWTRREDGQYQPPRPASIQPYRHRTRLDDLPVMVDNDAIAALPGGAEALHKAAQWRRGTRQGLRPRQTGGRHTDLVGDHTLLTSRPADTLGAWLQQQRSSNDRADLRSARAFLGR